MYKFIAKKLWLEKINVKSTYTKIFKYSSQNEKVFYSILVPHLISYISNKLLATLNRANIKHLFNDYNNFAP